MTTPARPSPQTPTNGTVVNGGGANGAVSSGTPHLGPTESSGVVARALTERQTDGGQSSGPVSLNPDPYIGQTLEGRYLIDKILGEGGMGVVYAARHSIIGKRVAIKILRSEYTRDQEILDRFVLEAKTASSIGNPHIVDISDFGRAPDNATFFVMEYLEGESLADAMQLGGPGNANSKAKPLAIDRLYKIALQICDGLGAAHERGIVHRDLKPENIYLIRRGEPDFVKVLDFGIAKVSNDSTHKITRAGAVFGTPQYMSPEQAAGGSVDHRADIYALGVILYEMVSGQLPFDGDNFMGILTQHMYKAPVPVRALVNTAECPPGLEAVIQKCLLKRPENRYQTMAELGADIKRLTTSSEPRAVSDMMARSGSTSVPQDYFKSAQVAVIPASPPSRQARGIPGWVYAVGVLSAAVLVTGAVLTTKYFAQRHQGSPTSTASVVTAEPPPAEGAAPPTETAATSTSVVAAKPVKVTLDVTPKTALLKRGGKPFLGREIVVAPGEKVELEASAMGFASQTVVIDGSTASVAISLSPRGPGGASTIRPPPTAKPGEVVDTWK